MANTAKTQAELQKNTGEGMFEDGGKETSDALLIALENSGIKASNSDVEDLSKEVIDKLSEGLPKELFNLMQGLAENEDEEIEDDEEGEEQEQETTNEAEEETQPELPQGEAANDDKEIAAANDDIENLGTEKENNEIDKPPEPSETVGEKPMTEEEKQGEEPKEEGKPKEGEVKPEQKEDTAPEGTEQPKKPDAEKEQNPESEKKTGEQGEEPEEKPAKRPEESEKPKEDVPQTEQNKEQAEKPEGEPQPEPQPSEQDKPSADAGVRDKKQGEEEKPEGEPSTEEPGDQAQAEQPQQGEPNANEQKPAKTNAQKCPNCGADMKPDGSCDYCGKKADQGDANSEKGGAMQGLNYLMHRKKIKQLDNETEQLNKAKEEINDKIKKINDEIGPDEKKIKILKVGIIALTVVKFVLLGIALLLAITIIFLIFIPIAGIVYAASSYMDIPITALKAEKKLLEKKIEPKKEERDKLEKKLKKINAMIRTKFIERRNMINQSAGQNLYQGVMGKK